MAERRKLKLLRGVLRNSAAKGYTMDLIWRVREAQDALTRELERALEEQQATIEDVARMLDEVSRDGCKEADEV